MFYVLVPTPVWNKNVKKSGFGHQNIIFLWIFDISYTKDDFLSRPVAQPRRVDPVAVDSSQPSGNIQVKLNFKK